MKAEARSLSSYKYRVTVEVRADELSHAMTEGIELFFNRVGARPLGADENLNDALVLRFGEERASQALTDAVIDYLLPAALDQTELVPAVAPLPLRPRPPKSGMGYRFEVDVCVRPDLGLSSYEPAQVTVKRPRVDERDVDNQLLALAQQAAEVVEDPDTGLRQSVLPALTDNWVKQSFPVDTVNTVVELRAYVRAGLQARLDQDFEHEKVNAAVSALCERLDGEIPGEMIETMKKDMIAAMEEDFVAQGTTIDKALKEQKISRAKFEEVMEARARQTLAEGFTMDAVFKHEAMELSDEDIEQTILGVAATANPDERDEAARYLREMGRTPALIEVAKRMKAGAWIAEHAAFTIEE